jgi:hypothetical protein
MHGAWWRAGAALALVTVGCAAAARPAARRLRSACDDAALDASGAPAVPPLPASIATGALPIEAALLGTPGRARLVPDAAPLRVRRRYSPHVVRLLEPVVGSPVRVLAVHAPLGVAFYVDADALATVTRRRTFVFAAAPIAGRAADDRTTGAWLPAGTPVATASSDEDGAVRVTADVAGYHVEGFAPADAIGRAFAIEAAPPKAPRGDLLCLDGDARWLDAPDGHAFARALAGSGRAHRIASQTDRVLARADEPSGFALIGWLPAAQARCGVFARDYDFRDDTVAGDLVRPAGRRFPVGTPLYDRPFGRVIGAIVRDLDVETRRREGRWLCTDAFLGVGDLPVWLEER